jgi:asparagine synthase (glutamine-hydrolysing)
VASAELPSASRYASYLTVFSADVRSALLRAPAEEAGAEEATTLARHLVRCGTRDPLNRSIYVDLKTSLPDDLLALTDKMTMAASIECRAPFIDHELVELTARMPSWLKVKGFTMKYLLKQVVQPWLPRAIIERPKRGFGAPIGSWLRKEMESLLDETLSEQQVARRGLFDWTVVRDLLERHRRRRADCTDQLLALVTLELWCRTFLDARDLTPRGLAAA